jgi:hypothetical protein
MMVVFSVVVAAYAAVLLFFKDKHKELITSTLVTVGVMAFSAFVFISQYVFYNGDWPNHSRYDFPGVLVIPLYISAFLLLIYKILKTYSVSDTILRGLWFGAWTGLICVTIMRGYVAIQVRVADNVKMTGIYTDHIKKAAGILRANPDRPLVIESGNPWDYEPVYANSKFLRAYGVTNTMYLRLHGYSPQTVADGLEKQLATELFDLQKKGSGEYSALPSQLSNCYSILLIDTPTECEVLKQ